jgi:hypothetical protein
VAAADRVADDEVPGGLLVDDPAGDKTDEADDAGADDEEAGAEADDAIVGELGGWDALFLCPWEEHPAATTVTAVRATKIRHG